MGMSIRVGVAPVEPGSYIEADLAAINAALAEHGLGRHEEPDQIPDDAQWQPDELPYTFFDRLQRVQAWVNQDRGLPEPLADGDQARNDPMIEAEIDLLSSHVVLHNPIGYYVPIDFDEPLIAESVTGKAIGSSQRLLDDLERSGEALGIERDGELLSMAAIEQIYAEVASGAPYGKEKLIWFALYDAARRSVAHRAVVLHE